MIPVVISALIVLIMIMGCVIAGRKREAEFKKQFPPSSDEEFLARCSPGTNPAVALKVRRIVAEQLGVEYERIYPSSSFTEDLGAD